MNAKEAASFLTTVVLVTALLAFALPVSKSFAWDLSEPGLGSSCSQSA